MHEVLRRDQYEQQYVSPVISECNVLLTHSPQLGPPPVQTQLLIWVAAFLSIRCCVPGVVVWIYTLYQTFINDIISAKLSVVCTVISSQETVGPVVSINFHVNKSALSAFSGKSLFVQFDILCCKLGFAFLYYMWQILHFQMLQRGKEKECCNCS